MPGRGGDQQGAVIVETGQQHRRPPLPHSLTQRRRIGFFGVLEIIVDDRALGRVASKATTHARAEVGPAGAVLALGFEPLEDVELLLVALDLEAAGLGAGEGAAGEVNVRENPVIFRAVHDVLDLEVVERGIILAIGRAHDG